MKYATKDDSSVDRAMSDPEAAVPQTAMPQQTAETNVTEQAAQTFV